MNKYDLIIIGAGPAGLTAAIYALTAKLKVAIIERNAPGGKLININNITNFPTEKEINGTDLALKMFDHAYSLGLTYITDEVIDIKEEKDLIVKCAKNDYLASSIIIATGTVDQKANIENEDHFFGKGVSYCAVCDGAIFKDKEIAVIGDYDRALEEAIYLSIFASKLYLICSKARYTNKELLSQLENNKKVEILYNEKVLKIEGKEVVESIKTTSKDIAVSAVFPFIGLNPSSKFATRLGIINEKGYILVNEKMETSIKGIYGAGDVINKELRQIVTANNDGAIAANQVIKYLNEKRS